LKRKALFIINPVSGGKKKDGVPGLIRDHLDLNIFDYDIAFSAGVAHAREIAREACGKFAIIVAVGGDGTVNEVASGIAGSDTVLGIIPFGSGNGLSRFLSIPMQPQAAFDALNKSRVINIDAAKMNGSWFFNMAGMGFDAHISHVFAQGSEKRGFFGYFKSSIQEIAKYKSHTYHINIDGKEYDREAFMLSFANSSQYGNNAHVSPQASVQDGLLDICIIKPFPLWRFPEMGLRMFTRTADTSKYVEIIQGKHITVTRQDHGPVHLDGEPTIAGTKFDIELVPGILKVIVGGAYHK